jgi:hypothetical protein
VIRQKIKCNNFKVYVPNRQISVFNFSAGDEQMEEDDENNKR